MKYYSKSNHVFRSLGVEGSLVYSYRKNLRTWESVVKWEDTVFQPNATLFVVPDLYAVLLGITL